MHKTASLGRTVLGGVNHLPIPAQALRQEEKSNETKAMAAESIGRRDFIKPTGWAVAGLTAASSLLS